MKTVEDWQNSGLGFISKDLIQNVIDDVTAHHQSTIKELSGEVAARTKERDDAIREANRRDQKWMDGINEILGQKLDYTDPCSHNNPCRALEMWRDILKSQVEERNSKLAKVEEFMAATQKAFEQARAQVEQRDGVLGMCENVLAGLSKPLYRQGDPQNEIVNKIQCRDKLIEQALAAIHKLKG